MFGRIGIIGSVGILVGGVRRHGKRALLQRFEPTSLVFEDAMVVSMEAVCAVLTCVRRLETSPRGELSSALHPSSSLRTAWH